MDKTEKTKKTCLLILDGFALTDDLSRSAISPLTAPWLTGQFESGTFCRLSASGEDVGLPAGQMGNSEVGHMNMGAGRIVYQELTRISKAVEDGNFYEMPAFLAAAEIAKARGVPIHLMGLVSDGGVHSSDIHYNALVETFRRLGVANVFIHCFLDGRDTPPSSARAYVADLMEHAAQAGNAKVASLCGRYYAMDRDNRYERVQAAYDMLTGQGQARCSDPLAHLEASYNAGVTDEFVAPVLVEDEGRQVHPIGEHDVVVFFNFRADRARELSRAFMEDGFTGFGRVKPADIYFVTMTSYEASFDFAHVAFENDNLTATLGEIVSEAGIGHLRIAETEKYAHVTYFFSGGREEAFAGEDRILIPSPKVATYDLAPQMSAGPLTDSLVESIASGKWGLVVANFANCDMVGHTGVFEAARQAVSFVDACARRVWQACEENGYVLLITADHGNAEVMVDEAGSPHTAHTTNPVPFLCLGLDGVSLHDGRLADIAPSILEIMGIDIPLSMKGLSLFN